MNEPTMLYRCPGPETFEGVSCETAIVDEADVAAHLADGWSRNWIEADAAAKAKVGEKLKANEAEQARIVAEIEAGEKAERERVAASAGDASNAVQAMLDAAAPKLQAVHKGRGKWDVLDAAGAVVASGLTGEEAKARAAG